MLVLERDLRRGSRAQYPLADVTWAVGLDPVARGIGHEGSVIIGTVIRTDSRFAVIAPARCKGRSIKRVHGPSCRRLEAKMQTRIFVRRNRTFGGENPKSNALPTVAEAVA